MTNYEIARLLREFKQSRKDARELHAEMLRIVVNELGIHQKVAQNTNLEAFLEGYLAGQEQTESCQTMTSYQISALLRHGQQIKKKSRQLRQELLRIAVEELSMEQDEARQANLEVFIDGYLVGQGMIQSWRKCGT